MTSRSIASSDDELPPRLPFSPNERLIRHHYENAGCYSWNADRFRRLCMAMRQTPSEMGERVGLRRRETLRCMERNEFPDPVGILLTFHERYIQAVHGAKHTDELFPP